MSLEEISELLFDNFPELFKAVVKININDPANQNPCGTGFIVTRNKNGNQCYYLVTNKHVLAKNDTLPASNSLLEIYPEIIVQFYRKGGGVFDIKIEILDKASHLLNTVKLHPLNFIDIAAIDITFEINTLLSKLEVSFFVERQIMSTLNFNPLGIDVGTSAWLFGYPHCKALNANNYPYSIPVVITSLSSKVFTVVEEENRDAIQDKINNLFLAIEGDVKQGMSGGPVIVTPKESPFLAEPLIIGIASIFGPRKAHAYKAKYINETLDLFS